jgi:hypothetical protein
MGQMSKVGVQLSLMTMSASACGCISRTLYGLLCSAAIYEPFTDIIGEDCHINKHVLVSQNLDDARIDRWPCNTDGAGHNSKDTEHNAKWRHAHRLCSVHESRGLPRAAT